MGNSSSGSLLQWLATFIGALAAFFAVVIISYNAGMTNGKQEIKTKWDAQQAQDLRATIKLQDRLLQAAEKYREREKEINHELQKSKTDFANSLNGLRNDFKQRLRSAETRSEVYLRRAETGTAECRNLADHTARLDKSLEEGRFLVRELGETVRQRDAELITVGKQLLSVYTQVNQFSENQKDNHE